MTSDPIKREAPADGENGKRRNGLLAIAGFLAIGVTLVSSVAIANNSARPFSADFTATRAIDSIFFTGTGIATHLGKFDLNGYRVIDGQPTPFDPCVGFEIIVVTLTAANGDELWLEATDGELCFDISNFPLSVPFLAEADFVGTGGTGRFSESTGDFRMVWSGDAASAMPSFAGKIQGTVGY